MLSVSVLSVVMLNVIMLSVVMLNAFRLSVVAPVYLIKKIYLPQKLKL